MPLGHVLYGSLDLAGLATFPSVADAAFLAFYPLALIGLLGFPSPSSARDLANWRVWSNVLIVLVGGAMGIIHYVLVPTLGALDEDPLAMLISLAYPMADLALVAAIASLNARQPYARDRLALTYLGGALVGWFMADLLFAIQEASGSYPAGGLADALWVAGTLAFAGAALAAIDGAARSDGMEAAAPVAVGRVGFYLMLLFGLTTLVLATAGQEPEIEALAILAVLLTSLVVLRQLADETQRRRAEAALIAQQATAAERAARQVRQDPLTGLPNRLRLRELLRAELEGSKLTGRPLALAFLDLDLFKAVNDTFGHAAGDRLLVAVGQRLQAAVRGSDTVARLGGDEFAIVMPATPLQAALDVAARAKAAVEQPYEIAGLSMAVGGSFGLAAYPETGTPDGDLLMRQADTAMYRAKRGRLGPTAYLPSFEAEGTDDVALLRAAIEGHGLELQYQRILDCRTGRTAAMEALVRWRHPLDGMRGAGAFLPIAAAAGLLPRLDERVLALACAQARAWRAAGLRVPVSVNVSSESLGDSSFSLLLTRLLTEHELPGDAIGLEVTEIGLLENAGRARDLVAAVGALGVTTAIDDFGTGYSSLGRLRDLPAGVLKIDGSFVTRALDDPASAAIVEALVGLGHRLDKLVVAEGVETAALLVYVRALGVDYAQGYVVGPPEPPDEALRHLLAEAGPTPARRPDAAA